MHTLDRRPASDIRRAFVERRAVLFCGAGISIEPPATLPDWKTLRDETIKAVAGSDQALLTTLPTLLQQRVDGGIGDTLAPELVATIARGVVPDYFQSLRVLDHDQPNRNHALIARLAKAGLLRYILSTNFDQLVETACSRENVELRVLRSDEDFAAFTLDEADGGPPVLFKLHGCISIPDTIVATVEQEAVGLSPPKSAVLQSMWNALTGLFWGYSGADLKLDIDYLKLLTTAATARGFWWNLYASGDYREEPNEFVQRLVSELGGRGAVTHETLVETLGPLVDVTPSARDASVDVSALKRQRSEALIASLAAWAKQSVQQAHACEILARLHHGTGDAATALQCYQRLADHGHRQGRFAIEAAAYTGSAAILARAGDWERLEEVLQHADDRARSAGSLELDLQVARIRAEAMASAGRVLSAIQPRAFASRLAPWAPAAAIDVHAVDLDTAEELANQRLFEPALAMCRAVEDEARQAGRLVQVADALARRSRVHALLDERDDAIACAREAGRLASVLGMRTEARLLERRTQLLQSAAAGTSDSGKQDRAVGDLVRHLDDTRNERLTCQTLLEVLESAESEIQDGLAAAERIRSYVATRGGLHLAVRLAVAQCRFLGAAGRVDDERRVIEEVRPLLWRKGNEAAAQDLLTRLAVIEEAAGHGADRVLQIVEQVVCIMRRTFGFAQASEQALARLRVRAGRVPALPSVATFLQTWQAHFAELPQLLPRLARAAGVSQVEQLPRSLEEQVGPEVALVWLVWSTASLCRQLREAGEPGIALAVAEGTQPMAPAFGDRQLSAILHNECGLNLLVQGEPERALERFGSAIADAEVAGDLAELVDDHVNAADACVAMGRFDEAVAHLARARQYVEARQDLERAATVTLRLGEALKALNRDQDALAEFQTAEYFTRTLGWSRKLEQSLLRLGKLHWNCGEFEASIRYRDEIVTLHETRGQADVAASFALLVANTYDEKLERPAEAALYYRRALALNEPGGQLDTDDLKQRLGRCEARTRDTRGGLWDLLLASEASEESAEQTAARLALAVDFNLWRFEPRSFCAWYERVFGGAVAYPDSGDPEVPVWPFAAIHQLVELARSARELRRHEDSLRHAQTADRLSQAFGIAQGRYLAAQTSAATCAELGQADLHAGHLARAAAARREFDAAAAARGLRSRQMGERTLEPWNMVGFHLALSVPGIPDVSTRHAVVKGRLVDDFLMDRAPTA